jgi:hypothetical protein
MFSQKAAFIVATAGATAAEATAAGPGPPTSCGQRASVVVGTMKRCSGNSSARSLSTSPEKDGRCAGSACRHSPASCASGGGIPRGAPQTASTERPAPTSRATWHAVLPSQGCRPAKSSQTTQPYAYTSQAGESAPCRGMLVNLGRARSQRAGRGAR